jgi:polyhydroxyalkanoate synthesis regulator protein
MNFALMDNKTGNNIQHVTYIVSIYNQENKNNLLPISMDMMEKLN